MDEFRRLSTDEQTAIAIYSERWRSAIVHASTPGERDGNSRNGFGGCGRRSIDAQQLQDHNAVISRHGVGKTRVRLLRGNK